MTKDGLILTPSGLYAPEILEGMGWTVDREKGTAEPPKNGKKRDPFLRMLESTLWEGRQLVDYVPPAREWIVKYRIPKGEVTLFSGRGGLGKSTIAIQLQCAMASARAEWLGYEVTSGASIGIYCEEQPDELARRFQAARKRMGVDWEDFGLVRYHCLKGEVAYLADWADSYHRYLEPTDLLWAIQAHIEAHGASLCVLDSLNRLFPGNENDRVQVTDFCRHLEQVAATTGCAIVLLSHPSKSALMDGSGFSGSTAWESMVRSRFYLAEIPVKEEDKEYLSPVEIANRPLRLIWAKGNYSAAAPDIEIERSPDPDDPDEMPPIYQRCDQAESDDISWFCLVIDALHEEGQRPRPSGQGRGKDLYAPALVFRHKMNRQRRLQNQKPLTIEQCEALYQAGLRAGRLCIRELNDEHYNKRATVCVNEFEARPF